MLSFQSWYRRLPGIIFCSGGRWHKMEVCTGLGLRLMCHSLGKSDFCRQYRKLRKSMKTFMMTIWKTPGGRSTGLSITTTWPWVVLLNFDTLHCYSPVTSPFTVQNASHRKNWTGCTLKQSQSLTTRLLNGSVRTPGFRSQVTPSDPSLWKSKCPGLEISAAASGLCCAEDITLMAILDIKIQE